MSALIPIITALLRALIPALVQYLKPTSEDASRAPEMRERLVDRIRGTWGRAGASMLLLALLVGCTTHSVYVPEGSPVRLRQTVDNVDVWILNEQGEPTASVMDLPEGWYVLPMPEAGDIGSD